ncbi:glutathione S-transferase family protein [Paracoccus aminophilus]|uniref:Glutathione S-transferase n=1 Tax=Paracoccus aminophilus JCM 7686 TaxID=1367847 RepID=S5XY97_PARAH|nr:glutathione S-transferase N-terminal domain-containing protein [Paracoccus aminophilus]AGT10287.1 glutathione S-transferase [Paracoccus aminophilus JCM 7686]
MILYDYVLSPNCYKARLMAALTEQKLDLKALDVYPGNAHKQPAFLALNPAGTVPVLTTGALTLTDSAAILVYLAKRAGGWLGEDTPEGAALVQNWLAFAQGLTDSLGVARLHDMLTVPVDIEAARARGIAALRALEAALFEGRLAGRAFLLGDAPSIADIACFPHVALAEDGGVTLAPYPSVRLWLRAVRALPGFIEMPGIHRLHDQKPEPGISHHGD